MFNRVLISTLPFISSIIAAPVMRAYSPHHDFDFEHDVIGTRAKGALISTQRGSWEQGTAAEALLEFEVDRLSVFNDNFLDEIEGTGESLKYDGNRDFKFGGEDIPVQTLQIVWDAVVRQNDDGRLAVKLGDEIDGSASDPSSVGPAVYLASKIWPIEEEREKLVEAAEKQLDYILHKAPRDKQGAISHRTEKISYWSDSVYMTPPLISYAGALKQSRELLHEAYAQIRDYREKLLLDNGLFGHILDVNGTEHTWEDKGAWSTGNGWVAGGIARVIATIKHSKVEGLDDELHDLKKWLKELLHNAYKTQKESGLLPNYLDESYVNDKDYFEDAAGTSAITAAAYRLGKIFYEEIEDILPQMEKAYKGALDKVNVLGILPGKSVNALDWSQKGQGSPESEAFILELIAAKEAF